MSVYRVTAVLSLLFGTIRSGDHRRARLVGIIQGITTNLGSRVVSIFVSFLSVPLTIGYLGPERYGAWITLGSLLAWLGLTDFGVGNGLTNAVTTAVGQERPDLVRSHVTNGLILLSMFALITAVLASLAWPYLNFNLLFGLAGNQARAEIGPAIMLATAIFLLQVPLIVSSKIYRAYREGRIENYWGMISNLASLGSLLVVTHTHGGLVLLVAAVSGTSLIISVVNTGWLFIWHKPFLRPSFRAINFAEMPSLLDVGGKFFLIQIMALITFQTDNLVIGHYLGASNVPTYNITYRLFDYAILPQTLLFPYLWTAYSEAMARKDIAWVGRTFKQTLFVGTAFSSVAAILISFIAKSFIAWWAGHSVTPSSSLIIWMASWCVINAFANPMGCLLAAAANMRAQVIYSSIATLLNIFLSINLVKIYGVDGVIAATVISYAIFICAPAYIDVHFLLKRLNNAV